MAIYSEGEVDAVLEGHLAREALDRVQTYFGDAPIPQYTVQLELLPAAASPPLRLQPGAYRKRHLQSVPRCRRLQGARPRANSNACSSTTPPHGAFVDTEARPTAWATARSAGRWRR